MIKLKKQIPRGTRIFCALITLVIHSACQDDASGSLDPTYKSFAINQSQWKSKTMGHFVHEITYRATEVPITYYLLKNQGINNLPKVDSLAMQMQNERIIEFEFEHLRSKDLLIEEFTSRSYEEAVKYLASSIQKDFVAITSSNDTIACSGVHFERNFNVAPYKRVLLYFGNVPPNEPIQLLYQDHLFNNGPFQFKFDENPFKS